VNDNDVVIKAWNTVLFEKFVRFKHLLIGGLASHSDELFSRRPFPPGSRVLDVGCGFGDSTVRIAREVGPDGEALGNDCADNFIEAAQHDARAAGVSNATFSAPTRRATTCVGPTITRLRASVRCSS
jgi:ubiquinone/menaquinone biosynthesis C-methylase UbiE